MLNKEQAKQTALNYINSSCVIEDDEIVILDEETIEKPYGWVFFYTSGNYLRTGDLRFLLAGNSPILIEKKDGSLAVLGTALPVEDYIREYEKKRSAPNR